MFVAFALIPGSLSCVAQAVHPECVVPPIHDLLLRADKSAAAYSDALPDYEYIEVESGTISMPTRETEPSDVYLVYSVKGVNVRRKYLKNGSTISASESKKIDEDIEKAVARGVKEQKSSKKPKPDETYATLEKAGSFQYRGCRTVTGRTTAFFTYTGNKDAKTSGVEQKVAKHFAGDVQFDLEDGAVRSAAFTLSSDMRLFVLFKLRRGTVVTNSSIRVAPGLWMPLTNEFSGAGRVFFNGLSASMREDFVGYRRVPRRDTDPYRGIPFGQLDPAVRSAMVEALEAATHYPPVDTDQ